MERKKIDVQEATKQLIEAGIVKDEHGTRRLMRKKAIPVDGTLFEEGGQRNKGYEIYQDVLDKFIEINSLNSHELMNEIHKLESNLIELEDNYKKKIEELKTSYEQKISKLEAELEEKNKKPKRGRPSNAELEERAKKEKKETIHS